LTSRTPLPTCQQVRLVVADRGARAAAAAAERKVRAHAICPRCEVRPAQLRTSPRTRHVDPADPYYRSTTSDAAARGRLDGVDAMPTEQAVDCIVRRGHGVFYILTHPRTTRRSSAGPGNRLRARPTWSRGSGMYPTRSVRPRPVTAKDGTSSHHAGQRGELEPYRRAADRRAHVRPAAAAWTRRSVVVLTGNGPSRSAPATSRSSRASWPRTWSRPGR